MEIFVTVLRREEKRQYLNGNIWYFCDEDGIHKFFKSFEDWTGGNVNATNMQFKVNDLLKKDDIKVKLDVENEMIVVEIPNEGYSTIIGFYTADTPNSAKTEIEPYDRTTPDKFYKVKIVETGVKYLKIKSQDMESALNEARKRYANENMPFNYDVTFSAEELNE